MRKLLSLLTLMLLLFTERGIAQVTIPEGNTTGDNPTYYVLKSLRSGNYMSVSADGVPNQSSTLTANCFWYFLGATENGMFTGQIGNYSYKDSETPFLFRDASNDYSLTAEGSTWYVKANPYPANAPKGVVISSNQNLGSNTCIDESSGTELGVWNPKATDYEGTTWVVNSVEDLFNDAMAEAKTILSTKGWGGFPLDAAYETLESTLNGIATPTTPVEYYTAIESINAALNTFYASTEVNKLEDGYYRFECQNGNYNTYFCTNILDAFSNIGTNIIVRDKDKNNPGQASIWYLQAQNPEKTVFTFRNAATGEYLNDEGIPNYNNTTKTAITTSKTPKTISITYCYQNKAGNIAIKGNGTTLFLNGDFVESYGDGVGSVWRAVPVDASQVRLSNGYYRFLCQNGGDNNNYFRVNTFNTDSSNPTNVIIREPDKNNPTLASVWYLEGKNADYTEYTFKNAATGEYLSNTGISYNGNTTFVTSKRPATMSVKYDVADLVEGCIQIKGNSNITMFLNGPCVTSWTYSNGPGTAWEPMPIDESDLDQYITEDLVTNLANFYTSEYSNKPVYFGYNSYNLSGATEEKNALDENLNFANYHAYMIKVDEGLTVPKENAFYYIVSAYQNFTDGKTRALYFDENANNPKWKVCEKNEAPMLWKLQRYTDSGNPEGFSICNANNGKYIKGGGYGATHSWNNTSYAWSLVSSSVGTGKAGTIFNIVNSPDAGGSRQTMALNGANGYAKPTLEEASNTITTYNDYSAPFATQWQIIEAESVDLKTNKVADGEYWATAYLPATIQLPEGARGFYVSSTTSEGENGEANLSEVADGIVPAENGALIYSDNADDNGYITASIVYDNTAKELSGNLLQGSLTKTNVPETGYIFTSKDYGLGFYIINPNSREIAGNKAYLVPKSGASQIQAFSFNFNGVGDATTNIENTVAEENAPKVYYDLQGRRVMSPTKGIYITNDGKKVIFNK